MEHNFFLKTGYKARTENQTLDHNRDKSEYWSPLRIEQSKAYQHHVYCRARDLIKQHHLRSVIDLGCGLGMKLSALIAPWCADIVGLDQSSAIAQCRSRWPFGLFLEEDLENPSLLLNRKFDLVICADVLEHLVNPDRLMNYIIELCHSSTYVVLSTPDRDVIRGPNCFESPKLEHVREWNNNELRSYVKHFDFVVIESRRVLPKKLGWNLMDVRFVLSQLRVRRSLKSCQLVVCRRG